MIRLSTFLYERQQGRCYLGITQHCRSLDRYMHPDQLLKGENHPRGWTWEHVIPAFVQKRIAGGYSLKLLACQQCNGAKGSSLPTDKQVEYALSLHEEYSKRAGADHSGAVKLVERYRAWLEPSKSDDPDVPNTVEEALAQGGIYVSESSVRVKKPRNLRRSRTLEQRRAFEKVRALRCKADRAESVGDHDSARRLREEAWGIIDARLNVIAQGGIKA